MTQRQVNGRRSPAGHRHDDDFLQPERVEDLGVCVRLLLGGASRAQRRSQIPRTRQGNVPIARLSDGPGEQKGLIPAAHRAVQGEHRGAIADLDVFDRPAAGADRPWNRWGIDRQFLGLHGALLKEVGLGC